VGDEIENPVAHDRCRNQHPRPEAVDASRRDSGDGAPEKSGGEAMTPGVAVEGQGRERRISGVHANLLNAQE